MLAIGEADFDGLVRQSCGKKITRFLQLCTRGETMRGMGKVYVNGFMTLSSGNRNGNISCISMQGIKECGMWERMGVQDFSFTTYFLPSLCPLSRHSFFARLSRISFIVPEDIDSKLLKSVIKEMKYDGIQLIREYQSSP